MTLGLPKLRTVSPTATAEECHLATDFDAWMEFIDPCGVMKEDEFDSLTVAEKLELIREAFEWTFQPDPLNVPWGEGECDDEIDRHESEGA